jgi:exodeoxyribonuclease III
MVTEQQKGSRNTREDRRGRQEKENSEGKQSKSEDSEQREQHSEDRPGFLQAGHSDPRNRKAFQPTGKGKRLLKQLVTYNVNSLTAALARPEGRLLDFIEKNNADGYALQETMVDPSRKMTGEKWKISPFCRRVKALGYHAYWHSGTRSKGGYGGILFLTRIVPEHVLTGTGDEDTDKEGRFMALIYSDAIVINCYTPTLALDLTGKERKDKFWEAAENRYLRIKNKYAGRPTIWMGDMNVAPLEKDADTTGIRQALRHKKLKKELQNELPSCTRGERAAISKLQQRLNPTDAFENQRDVTIGRDALTTAMGIEKTG